MGNRISIEDRFWSKVDRLGPNDCRLWKGARSARSRYGQVNFDGKTRQSHRVAWFLTFGEWPPPSTVLCHSCDVTRCCNPAHLWVGTQAENISDMRAKQRGPNLKLTEEGVREIRRRVARGELMAHLAREFGVDKALVRRVVLRKSWRHVA